MKNIITLFALLALFAWPALANPVDENTAKLVGQNFLSMRSNSPVFRSGSVLQLVYTAKSRGSGLDADIRAANYFYVFDVDAHGFVIVAADDAMIPILAYSDEGAFYPNRIPHNAAKWLEGYKGQIRYAIDNELEPAEEVAKEWQSLKEGIESGEETRTIVGVGPLILTKWSQSPYYNGLCPLDYAYGERAVTGCVATAMAQVMKYWNYPETGTGFHSYNHPRYGTLSANFGGTTYQWASMPNIVNSPNNAVATLMYHCGVGVDMNYGVASSGAQILSDLSPVTHCAEYALKTYFDYKNTLRGEQKAGYSDQQWKILLRTDLDAGRPILYGGLGTGGGHAFVCDGYDNNDLFHFNWGWGGNSDGYFYIGYLNPGSLGTGGGTGGYNSMNQAIIGIEPPGSSGEQAYNLSLYNYVTLSANPLQYGASFNVSTNIANEGPGNFSGDYCAAVFDDAYTFIDFVEVKTGYSLQAGYVYTNNLVFSSAGLMTMLPGTYYVGIFYRPTEGNWAYVGNSGSYVNFVQVQVGYSSDIELSAPITVNPGAILTQGQPASVNFNVYNSGYSTFTGQYDADLYRLDGSWVENIGSVDETNGLPPGYTYAYPYINFQTNAVVTGPGTYLLAVTHKRTGSPNWVLTGCTYYQNPIKVTIQQPAIQPDLYEPNDAVAQAYTLPLSFSGNNATRNTIGSNCHISSDYDFYRINLPAGYAYSITPRLHDAYNSGNGQSYTLDALFSYSTDGSNWSDAFDDVVIGSIASIGGSAVYFHVAPYFAGETGTYLLDMSITRASVSAVVETEPGNTVKLYPNPAGDFVNVDLSDFQGKVHQVVVSNFQGQALRSFSNIAGGEVRALPLAGLPEAVYLFQFLTDRGVLTKKIAIAR